MVDRMRTAFVEEVSSNYTTDLERCHKFIVQAADAGCDAVKFQLFRIDELFAPEILAKREDIRRRKMWELPTNFLPELSDLCHQKQIKFSCTPFYLNAVDELAPYVDFYKIASYELLWDDLLKRCAKTQKPIVLATGMADLSEIDHAADVLRLAGAGDITLLHCVSQYPCKVEECNLAAIETLRHRYGVNAGWSDHSANAGVIYRAVGKWQASMVEFHLDIDGKGEEFGFGHCWLPNKIGRVMTDIRSGNFDRNAGKTADGYGKKIPVDSEQTEKQWRADPSDGLRPLLKIREEFRGSCQQE